MPQIQFTRRQLLKALLAAGGGLSASALLPSKWLKPVLKSGVLPAHAQTSIGPFTINMGQVIGEDGGLFLLDNIRAYVVWEMPDITAAGGWGVSAQGDISANPFDSIPDIPVTMDYQVFHNSVGNPDPALPRTLVTDLGGAFFGSQSFVVSGNWSFRLKFTAPGCVTSYSPKFTYDLGEK